MPSASYIWWALLIVFVITFSLRALPFFVLKPMQESRLIRSLGLWMPAGILVILALSTFRSASGDNWDGVFPALLAATVTIAVHLLAGRRTLLSVSLGTMSFVVLVNLA